MANQLVGVLVEIPFPGMIRIGEGSVKTPGGYGGLCHKIRDDRDPGAEAPAKW